MRIFKAVSWLALVAASIEAQSPATTRSVTIHSWTLDAASPQQLADISYNPSTLTSTIIKYNPPTTSSKAEDLVRVGLYDAATSGWRGVVTSLESFDEKYQQKLSLHIDEDGEVWHVGISTYLKSATSDIPQLVVEVVTPTPGAVPFLNRPVILNADGKIEEKEPEKTLFQRYWWLIGVVLFIQIMAVGGKD